LFALAGEADGLGVMGGTVDPEPTSRMCPVSAVTAADIYFN